MAAPHPKPDYRGGPKPPFGPWMDWAEQQLAALLGTGYGSVLAAVQGIAAAAAGAIDLSTLEDAIDALDTRVDDIEAADEAYRTFFISGRVTAMVNTAGVTSYAVIWGRNEGAAITTTIADAQIPIGVDCTIKDFRARCLTSSGDSDSFTLSINKNGSDTALTLTGLAGNDTTWHEVEADVDFDLEDLVCVSRVNGGADVLTNDIIWCAKVVVRS
jgi:hypothetical protein